MSNLRAAIMAILLAGALAACGGSDGSEGQKAETPIKEAASPDAQPPAAGPARPAAFSMCIMCHSDVKGKNGLGPSLHGVVGRKAGGVPGFAYSPAMKASDLIWDETNIDGYVQNPRETMPGNRMSYAGLKDAQKRAEIIGYLKTLK